MSQKANKATKKRVVPIKHGHVNIHSNAPNVSFLRWIIEFFRELGVESIEDVTKAMRKKMTKRAKELKLKTKIADAIYKAIPRALKILPALNLSQKLIARCDGKEDFAPTVLEIMEEKFPAGFGVDQLDELDFTEYTALHILFKHL